MTHLSFIMTSMKKQYFGTDGIRGEVGKFPIVPEFMTRLGYAAGKVLARDAKFGERCKILIGKDTCLLYTSPSPRDRTRSRMPSSA